MKPAIRFCLVCFLLCRGASAAFGQGQPDRVNLLSLQEGTLPVAEPASYSGWTVAALLDDSPESGWACETGSTKGNVFVFEMLSAAVIERFEFDNANIDDEGAAAKDVTVEVSATSMKAGFETVLKATLANKADRQGFKAAKAVNGRWLRLTIHSNYGSESWTELFSFRGYGAKPAAGAPLESISGTYETSYSKFHVRQQGTALVGCYEFDEGLLNGVIEGRLMKITWQESGGESDRGPAVMVFALDGKSFQGYWWNAGNEKRAPSGNWEGKKISSEVGGCPHWSGSLSGELKKKLLSDGRVRVYGILFDLDSAVIRGESRPVIDEVLAVLKGEPGWKLTIEGHTDSTGSAGHNQELSTQRAEAVKAYLVAGGIGAERLQTKGFGAGRPVADNASELGRAQNRRVELVRQ